MEFFFNLLKQLAATLSMSEFLAVLALIGGVAFYISRFYLKGKDGILGVIFNNKENPLQKQVIVMTEKFDTFEKNIEEEIKRISSDIQILNNLLVTLNNKTASDSVLGSEKITHLKGTLDNIKTTTHDAIKEINRQMQSDTTISLTNKEQVVGHLQRLNDILLRIELNIAKVDEFTKTFVPEFRMHFKDIYQVTSELSRDIGLLERSISTQHYVK